METVAVKSHYDEILHNKIYVRIKKSEKHWFLSLLTQLKTADVYGLASLFKTTQYMTAIPNEHQTRLKKEFGSFHVPSAGKHQPISYVL